MASETTNTPPASASYMAAISGLVPAAAATDILTIAGAPNRIIQINQITISGIATAAAAVPISIIKRTTANTAGTSAPMTAVSLDSRNGVALATLLTYTANPTLGSVTGGGSIATARLILSTASASVGSSPIVFSFERMYMKMPILLSASELLCVNYGGATASGNSIDLSISFTEMSQ